MAAQHCTSMQTVRDFLAQRRIAVAGVSRDPRDFSRVLFREFAKRGYELIPVHPEADTVEGRACFRSVAAIQPAPDAVLVLTSASATDEVLTSCAEAGVKRVWLYRAGGQGAVSPGAVEFCRAQGIEVVAGECPMMFFDASFPHRLHGWVRKVRGAYPQK